MEKVDDLLSLPGRGVQQQHAWKKRLGEPAAHTTSDNKNLVLQLGSNDPQKVRKCVTAALQHYGSTVLSEINLNCGCPAVDAGGAATYGASLMKDPNLTAQLVESCRSSISTCNSDVDVSVKCRIAVKDHVDDLKPSLGEEDFEYLHNYISTVSNAGANHVVLHARPAILSGLSPVKNRIVPTLDYEFCERIASDFPELKVTLNGGISSLSHLKSLHQETTTSAIDSHMAGRWILRRPLDLVGVEELLLSSTQTSPSVDFGAASKAAIEDYLDDCVRRKMSKSSLVTTADLCLPLFLIAEQLREDYDHADDDKLLLLSYEEMESLHDILQQGILQLDDGRKGKSNVNFKRLSTSFKSLVGTKVVNKWKRNRTEL